jgi:hypothetical protein
MMAEQYFRFTTILGSSCFAASAKTISAIVLKYVSKQSQRNHLFVAEFFWLSLRVSCFLAGLQRTNLHCLCLMAY